MKREWTLYFVASTVFLVLYIVPRFALDHGAAGEVARANPPAVVVACILVSVPTFLSATLASRSWRYGPMIGSQGGRTFAAVTIVSVWGAALADRNALLAQIYAIPELSVVLAYRRVLAVAAVINFGLVVVQALDGEPTPNNLSKWAVAAVATVVLTGLFGRPTDLLIETNIRNQELVGQFQARDAQIARLSYPEGMACERGRIAREMHNMIAQGLTSILALARAAVAKVAQAGGTGPPAVGVMQAGNAVVPANGVGANRQVSRHLVMIVELAQEGLDDTRRMIIDVSLWALDGRGLAEVVGRAADRLEREGAAVACSLDSTLPPLPQPARVAILRVAQEATANVARHFRAVNAVALLWSVARMAVSEVRDDGVGFDLATAGAVDAEGGSSSNQAALRSRPGSMDERRAGLARMRRVWQRGRLGRASEGDDPGSGIPDMRGRMAGLGGSASIDSSPESGTCVLARIPVEAPAMENAASAEGPTSRETASQASQGAVDSALQGKEKE